MSDRNDCADQARRVVALIPILRRWVSGRVAEAGAERDLSLRQYAALQGIRGGATTPGDLARLWQVTPAVITGILDRLERRDLVRREVDPLDRRRFQLALTVEGLAASDDVDRALTGDLATQLATASPEALAELGRSIDLLQRTFRALEEQVRSTGPCCADHDLPVWSMDETRPATAAPGAAPPQALLGARN